MRPPLATNLGYISFYGNNWSSVNHISSPTGASTTSTNSIKESVVSNKPQYSIPSGEDTLEGGMNSNSNLSHGWSTRPLPLSVAFPTGPGVAHPAPFLNSPSTPLFTNEHYTYTIFLKKRWSQATVEAGHSMSRASCFKLPEVAMSKSSGLPEYCSVKAGSRPGGGGGALPAMNIDEWLEAKILEQVYSP